MSTNERGSSVAVQSWGRVCDGPPARQAAGGGTRRPLVLIGNPNSVCVEQLKPTSNMRYLPKMASPQCSWAPSWGFGVMTVLSS